MLAELILQQNGQVRPGDIFTMAMAEDPAALAIFNEIVDIFTIKAYWFEAASSDQSPTLPAGVRLWCMKDAFNNCT